MRVNTRETKALMVITKNRLPMKIEETKVIVKEIKDNRIFYTL